MKILVAADVPPDPNSGAAGTEIQTINALRELGHEVDCLWADDLGRKIQHGNLHYLLELPKAYKKALAQACAKKDYDVLHINQGHCYLAAQEHLRQNRKGIFVFRSHGLDDNMNFVLGEWRKKLDIQDRSLFKQVPGKILDRLLNRHISLACKSVDGIIVSSSVDSSFLADYHKVDPKRIANIAQATPPRFLETATKAFSADRSKKILFIGSTYWKGVHAVAKAMNQLLSEDSSFSMTWICPESDLDAVKYLLKPEILDRISFPCWVSQDELMTIYDSHGFFLAPSLFEGFCKVFLEAMSRGLCIIATPCGGMIDTIHNGKNGILVGFNAPAEIKETLISLAENEEKLLQISQNARLSAETYTWKKTAATTAAFYRRLIDMKN